MRLKAIDAAYQFVADTFPGCKVAFLAGSASRGEDKPTSDLDLVVILREGEPAGYRESFERYGWKLEVFIHNEHTYMPQFEKERIDGKPILSAMMLEGIVLIEEKPGLAEPFKAAAGSSLAQGPEPLTQSFVDASRYFMFDFVDDFEDAVDEREAILTLNAMSVRLGDFILRLNGSWSGSGKTMTRALYRMDPELADRYFAALDAYYTRRDKAPMIRFVYSIYEPLGGRLYDGFSMGKH